MNFNPDDLLLLTRTIWESMLGLPIEPDQSGAITSGARSTVACIQITGAWNGAIVLECPVELARVAASIMFGAEPGAMTGGDLQDAIAELANMIGGNFKALLPETCYLSLPSAVEGGDYSARLPGSKVIGRVELTCQGHVVSTVFIEMIQEPASAA